MNKPAFKIIKYIDLNEIQLDAPVEISKGALILDNNHNRVLLQLKLKNISSETISAVFIAVDSYDEANDQIHNIETKEHSYLDLNVKSKCTFGDKNPMVVSSIVRNVKVIITKVVFSNGEIWRNDDNINYQLKTQEKLNRLDDNLIVYLKQMAKSSGYDYESLKYFPELEDELWLCTCGRPNRHYNNRCVRCGMDKKFIFDNTNEDILQNKYNDYMLKISFDQEEEVRKNQEFEKSKILKEEQKRRDEEQNKITKKKNRKRKVKRIIVFLSTFIVTVSILFYVILNHTKIGQYYYAGFLNQSKNYSNALSIYKELNGYMDSADKINDIHIIMGLEYLKTADYEKAMDCIEISDVTNEPEDTKISIANLFYIFAKQEFDLKNYNEASQMIIKANKVLDRDIKSYSNLNELSNKVDEAKALKRKNEIYDNVIKLYNNNDYVEVFNSFADQVGYYEINNYDWDSLNDFKDMKKYFIASKIKSLLEEYKDFDIMEYDHGVNQYSLKTLYESGKRIASFDNIEKDLNDRVFTSIWLEGRFTNGELYFVYSINEDETYEAEYNLPWYDGKYFRLIDYGQILQIGDEGSWRNTYKFTFSEDKNILSVYSYKNRRNYKLYRQ